MSTFFAPEGAGVGAGVGGAGVGGGAARVIPEKHAPSAMFDGVPSGCKKHFPCGLLSVHAPHMLSAWQDSQHAVVLVSFWREKALAAGMQPLRGSEHWSVVGGPTLAMSLAAEVRVRVKVNATTSMSIIIMADGTRYCLLNMVAIVSVL